MVLLCILIKTNNRWVYLNETLPPNWIRYSLVSCLVFIILIAVASPYCYTYLGRWTFFIFAMTNLLSGLFYYFFLVETKGKTLDEIHSSFESRSEERRVGKECTAWCRSGWAPYSEKKKCDEDTT